MDQVDVAGELRQVRRLLDRRVAAADDDERLVAEARQRPVADGAGGDAVVLEAVLRRQAEVVGPRAGGDDDGLGLDRLPPSRVCSVNGCLLKSTLTMSSVMMRVPKLTACCRMNSISSGPIAVRLPWWAFLPS